jgi:PPOX class probable FMN-dependent enzyme
MDTIRDMAALEALFDDAVPASLAKVTRRMTPLYRQWIDASRFAILSTVGPEGTDASPRGDDGPVVRVVDDHTVWMPDWRGNNRIDSLRNIVRDERVSVMFMVPGCDNVVRINGTAVLTADPNVTETFEQNGKHPKVVVVITIVEMYFQCAKAMLRSKLWVSEDESASVPTAGQFVRAVDQDFDAESYDSGYAENAKARMW